MRLTARLLDVQTGAALWSGSFDETARRLFALQDSLATQLVDALSVDLSEEAQQRLTQHYTENVEAWQLYLNGRYQWDRRNEEGIRKAIEYYDGRRTASIPGSRCRRSGWPTHGPRSACSGSCPPGVAFPRARLAAERAISLDGQLAEAQASLGHVLVQQSRDWAGGERQYRLRIEAEPDYAQVFFWLGNLHAYKGRLPEALVETQRAQSLEPMSLAFAANVGLIRYFMRDYDAALAQLEGLVEAAPQALLARNHLGRVYCANGEAGKAVQVLEDYPWPHGWQFLESRACIRAPRPGGCCEARDRARGRSGQAWLRSGIRSRDRPRRIGRARTRTCCARTGEHDVSQMIGFLNSEPGLDSIRDEPRFRAVSERLRLG